MVATIAAIGQDAADAGAASPGIVRTRSSRGPANGWLAVSIAAAIAGCTRGAMAMTRGASCAPSVTRAANGIRNLIDAASHSACRTDARFRRGLRIDSAAWGAVLLANAVVHVVLVYTLPVDLISLVTTVEWFASLACLITWHVWYIRKENLDA